MHEFQGQAGAPFAGGQGPIGYNPNWNAGSGYQGWPNQPQPADSSKYIFLLVFAKKQICRK